MHPGKIQVPRRTSRTRLTWQLSNLVKKETLDTLVECGNCKDLRRFGFSGTIKFTDWPSHRYCDKGFRKWEHGNRWPKKAYS